MRPAIREEPSGWVERMLHRRRGGWTLFFAFDFRVDLVKHTFLLAPFPLPNDSSSVQFRPAEEYKVIFLMFLPYFRWMELKISKSIYANFYVTTVQSVHQELGGDAASFVCCEDAVWRWCEATPALAAKHWQLSFLLKLCVNNSIHFCGLYNPLEIQ